MCAVSIGQHMGNYGPYISRATTEVKQPGNYVFQSVRIHWIYWLCFYACGFIEFFLSSAYLEHVCAHSSLVHISIWEN